MFAICGEYFTFANRSGIFGVETVYLREKSTVKQRILNREEHHDNRAEERSFAPHRVRSFAQSFRRNMGKNVF